MYVVVQSFIKLNLSRRVAVAETITLQATSAIITVANVTVESWGRSESFYLFAPRTATDRSHFHGVVLERMS